MKERPKIDLGMTGYDELFMNDQDRAENRLPKIYDIPLSEIDEFPDHPFKVKDDEDMLLFVLCHLIDKGALFVLVIDRHSCIQRLHSQFVVFNSLRLSYL